MSDIFKVNLDEKIELFLNLVAKDLEQDKNVDNARFKMHNIFYKKFKLRFKNLHLNNCTNNYNICNKYNMIGEDLCIAVLKTGKNKGQLCNKSVYIDKYCKKHCKNENTVEIISDLDSSKTVDVTKIQSSDESDKICSKTEQSKVDVEIINNIDEDKEEIKKKEIINTKENKVDKSKMVIDINKFGNFVFGNTGLVFNNDKKIIAKEGPNGEWLTLKSEDVEICKQYKLKYQVIQHERKLPENTKVLTRGFTILRNEWDDD
jgi:hypothetical protein